MRNCYSDSQSQTVLWKPQPLQQAEVRHATHTLNFWHRKAATHILRNTTGKNMATGHLYAQQKPLYSVNVLYFY